LDVGKAAEHLVCADLLLAGRCAYLSDQGLPYDVVVDVDGRLIRLQVKATMAPTNINASGRHARLCYSFSARRRGKNGWKRLSCADCDIIALVALDLRVVAYIVLHRAGQTIQLAPPAGIRSLSKNRVRWGGTIDQYPFSHALAELDLTLFARPPMQWDGKPEPSGAGAAQ
jgi:hypothetical protein